MKKLTLFFALLAFCMNAKAQQYYPLVDTNSVWNNLILWADGVSYNNYTVKFTSDTIINSFLYKKVLQIGYEAAPVQYIREDSTEKVFYKEYPDSADKLLYDFNLGLNDTVTITTSPAHPVTLRVDTVDSVNISGKERKRFCFSWVQDNVVIDNDIDTWIEGIGSLRGVLTTTNLGVINSQGDHLLCFTQNDTLKYISPGFTSCTYPDVGIHGYNTNHNAVEIFPNPAFSEILVIGNQSTVSGIEIYNMLGEKVYQSLVTGHYSPVIIDVSALQSGMYFMEVKSEKGVTVKKFIKE